MNIVRTALLGIMLCIGCSAAVASAHSLPRPKGFIPNRGQWPSDVLFAARTATFDVFVTRNGMTFARVRTSAMPDAATSTYQASWSGTPGASGVTYSPNESVMSIHRGATSFQVDLADRIVLRNIYRGVDVVFTMQEDRLRFDLDVRPGGDVSAIGLMWQGDARVTVDASGRKAVVDDCLVLGGLYVEQEGIELPSRFKVTDTEDGRMRMTFDVHGIDPSKRLIIDPVVYGAYAGKTRGDEIVAIKHTTRDEIIIAGSTESIEFPNANTPVIHGNTGSTDGIVARMDRKMTTVLAYTIIGGSDVDRIRAMCIDGANDVYVTGETRSPDFPSIKGTTGQKYVAGIDGFIVKLDSSLTKLLISVYHSGNKDDSPRAIAVGTNQLIYIAGTTTSIADLPVSFPAAGSGGGANGGGKDGFLASYSMTGRFMNGRYIGRAGNEEITALALDNSTGVYVTGSTTSTDFPTSAGAATSQWTSPPNAYDRSFNGGITDAFVAKFSDALAVGMNGTYSTYLGGSGDEEGRGICVDDLGRAYVVGVTKSPNLESISGLSPMPLGGQDLYLAVISDDGRTLKSLTYYGGSGDDHVLGVAAYSTSGVVIIHGYTVSSDFPTIGTAASSSRGGATDGFIAQINTSANRHCTLIGGAGDDAVNAVDVDPNGDVVFSMSTTSSDLPVHESSVGQTSMDRYVFIGKYAYGTLEITAPRGGESYCMGNPITINWQALDLLNDEMFAIDVSSDNGATWTELAKGIKARSYSWRPADRVPGSTYKLAVRTQRGHVTQTLNSFALMLPPSIAKQPMPTSVCLGQPVTLTIEATGSSIKYQWRFNGATVPGATSPTLQFELSANKIGAYDCVVSGACSPQAVSAVVNVTEATPTAITAQPKDVTVDEGAAFELLVAATGGSISYQWLKNGEAMVGATSATLRVAAASAEDAAAYRCVVTGGCGTVTSEPATVRVMRPTSVTDDHLSSLGIQLLGPQPADEVLRLLVDGSHDVTSIRIMDLSGRVVMMPSVSPAQILTIPVISLAPATYVLEVKSGIRSARATITIQR